MHDRELFIDGRWRAARQGRRTTIADPATGEPVGSTAIADANDIDDAVTAAKHAFPLWAGTHADERARVLHRAADLIVERLDAIADLLTREQEESRSLMRSRRSSLRRRSHPLLRGGRAKDRRFHPGFRAFGRA